jgi:enoyl-CoA hydratase
VTALPDATLVVRCEDNLALLLINNPRRRNALSAPILASLQRALSQAARDDQVGAVIIGSALEGVFASGGNIRELQALDGSSGGLCFAESAQSVFYTIETLPKPVVAAIDGYCFGAGAELAAATDIRIASERAVLALPQVGLGITPGLGGGQRLLRLCGPQCARRLILTAARIDAQEALRLGLVESVVPADELWGTAKTIAMRLARQPRTAMMLAKRMVNFASQAALPQGCAYEANQFGLACAAGYLQQRTLNSEGEGKCK